MVSLVGLIACATGPQLPPNLAGQSAIVLGFTTSSAMPYEGGTLYTGFTLDTLDGTAITPLSRYEYLLVAPGVHQLEGTCYWRLRGNLRFEDDILERGSLVLTTQPDVVYTIQSDIDEYKNQCRLNVVERAISAH
ncbi:MAG: hypothetical protein CMK89_13365 [Pseudomonadales bacterium]|nr:hypothetical protein [Pseudomonadales bacterium]